MSTNKKGLTNFTTRFVTTKKGTYLIWYDATFGRQRHVNLSRAHGNGRYLGTGGHQRG